MVATTNSNIQRLDRVTNWLLVLIIAAPFLISAGAVTDLARQNAVSYPLLYPFMVDGGLLIFKALALRQSLRGRRDGYAWSMAAVLTGISVLLNVVHVPATAADVWLARFMAALPPALILAAFLAVSRRIEESARWETAVQTYDQVVQETERQRSELDAMVQKRTAELEKLHGQIEQLAAREAALLSELSVLEKDKNKAKMLFGTGFEQQNADRTAQKGQAMNELLDYLAEHPAASYTDMGRGIGRARSTISRYVTELQEAGLLSKNGQGWQVRGEQ